MNNYPPLSCLLEDHLAAIAALKLPCAITYRNPQDVLIQVLAHIHQLYTAQGFDWCQLSDGTLIRLDHIEDFQVTSF